VRLNCRAVHRSDRLDARDQLRVPLPQQGRVPGRQVTLSDGPLQRLRTQRRLQPLSQRPRAGARFASYCSAPTNSYTYYY